MKLKELLGPKTECMKALEKVKKALDSLMETLRKRPGGTDNYQAKDLVIGITRAITTLFDALRNAADHCPNCDFLRP